MELSELTTYVVTNIGWINMMFVIMAVVFGCFVAFLYLVISKQNNRIREQDYLIDNLYDVIYDDNFGK